MAALAATISELLETTWLCHLRVESAEGDLNSLASGIFKSGLWPCLALERYGASLKRSRSDRDQMLLLRTEKKGARFLAQGDGEGVSFTLLDLVFAYTFSVFHL